MKFKVGDRIKGISMEWSPGWTGIVREVTPDYIRIYFDVHPTGLIPYKNPIDYLRTEEDMFELDQAYYNELEMRKLLGVSDEV